MSRQFLSRRQFLKVAGTASGGLLLAACAPSQGTPTQAPAPTTAGPTAAPQPVTITTNEYYWGPGYEPVFEDYRKVFDANGLDWLTVEHSPVDSTSLDVQLAAGDAPDLVNLYPALASPWAARKLLASLTPRISADAAWKADVDRSIPSMLGGYTFKDELYGLPTASEADVLSYNPDQFAKLGVPTPAEVGEENFTLAKFEEMIQALTDADMKGWFIDMDYYAGLGDVLYGMGGSYFSEDGKECLMNSPEFIEAVEFCVRQVKAGAAVNGIESSKNGEWVALSLANGKTATTIGGDWIWGWAHKTQLERGEIDLAMYYTPAGPSGRVPIAHSGGVGVNAKSEKLEAAMAYMKFGFTQAYQEVAARNYENLPRYPLRHDAAAPIFDKQLLPEFFPKLFDNSRPSPATPALNIFGVAGYWKDTWNNVMTGADTRSIEVVQNELQARTQNDMDAAAVGLNL